MEDDFIKGLEEDQKKYSVEEEGERLEWTGQENEKKGAKAICEVMKEEEEKKEREKNRRLEVLDAIRKKNIKYRENLLFLLHDGLKRLEWTGGWEWGVWFDGFGVLVSIKDHNGQIHKRAFKIIYETCYDYHAVNVFIRWADDLIDLLSIKKTEQLDIWTPSKPLN